MKRCWPLLAILLIQSCGKVEVNDGVGGSGVVGQVRPAVTAENVSPAVKDRVVKLCEHLETYDSNMRAAYLGHIFTFRSTRTDCGGIARSPVDSDATLALQADKLVFTWPVGRALSAQVDTHQEGKMAVLCKALPALKSPHYSGTTALYFSVIPCPTNSRVTCVTIETGIKNEAGGYYIQQVDEYGVESHASAGGLIGQVRSQRRVAHGGCGTGTETTVVDLLRVN